MILWSAPEYAELADQLLHRRTALIPGDWTARRFANGELFIELHTPVRDAVCLILTSISPPDAHLLTTLLLSHTLKKAGAQRVIALIPYLAYTRQDREEPGRSMATHWVGESMRVAGIDALLTVDIHSERARELPGLAVHSLSPASLWAREIARLGWQDATIVAPDQGAWARCEAVRCAAEMPPPVAVFAKRRTRAGVCSTFDGHAGKRAVIVDDILDTGGTLLACCEGLRNAGTEEVIVMVTHGLFTGNAWTGIWDLGVRRLSCTDTVPLPAHVRDERIARVSVLPLLESICWDTL